MKTKIYSKEIEKTMRNRWKEILLRINNVWKLEKQKAEWRDELGKVSGDIEKGLRGSGILLDYYAGSQAGAIEVNKQKTRNIQDSIQEIRNKQIQELEQIKSML